MLVQDQEKLNPTYIFDDAFQKIFLWDLKDKEYRPYYSYSVYGLKREMSFEEKTRIVEIKDNKLV